MGLANQGLKMKVTVGSESDHIIVRTPSWGAETYHANVLTLVELWMPIDCKFIGVEPMSSQTMIEQLEEGDTVCVGEYALKVTYSLRRLER